MTQPGRFCTCLEALLLAQSLLVLEQQGEPFGMFKCTRFGVLFELFEPFGHAVQAKLVQQIKCWMCEHVIISFQWK
jgi:hypothetical protein